MYTIMIADDEIEARDNMIACVNWNKLGVNIIGTADDGISAYEMLKTQQPDMILLDICMPGMNGLEVIRKAREEACLKTVFIIISGYNKFSYAQKAVEYHVNQYLLKPFSIDELEAAIQKAIPEIQAISRKSNDSQAISDFADYLAQSGDTTSTEVHYPSKEEAAILHCITMGERMELSNLVQEFLNTCKRDNPSQSGLFHSVMLLYSTVCKLMMQRGFTLSDNHLFGQRWKDDSAEALEVMLETFLTDTCAEAMDILDSTNNSNQLIRIAVAYINEHYREKVSLNDIAEKIHISPVYLSNLFSKVVGKSMTEYLQGLRIENAEKLLLNPQLTICDIAEQVGYSDSKYFVQVFKRITGVTPAAFRSRAALDIHRE